MNGFRLAGDVIHALGILLLLGKICKTRSCSGVSGVSQILYLITFITRYLDLGMFYSYYNTAMKNLFVSATAFTVFLIFTILRRTYDSKHDSNWMLLLLLPAAILSEIVNYRYTLFEVSWAFSQYLEAVAMLPQFFMIFKMGEVETTVVYYLLALASYRALYICNWVYRYIDEHFYDGISFGSGVVQTLLYCVFFFAYFNAKLQRSAVSGSELGDTAEKDAILVPDSDPPRKGNFIQVRGLTPYYEKAVLSLNRLCLVIQREYFALFGSIRAGDTVKTETPTKQCSCSKDMESAADKPDRDVLSKSTPSAAELPRIHLPPAGIPEKADNGTMT